jgi:hypothetical protein
VPLSAAKDGEADAIAAIAAITSTDFHIPTPLDWGQRGQPPRTLGLSVSKRSRARRATSHTAAGKTEAATETGSAQAPFPRKLRFSATRRQMVNGSTRDPEMAAYKVGDRLRLKQDGTFTRGFPRGGYKPDGDVSEYDKYRMKAGHEGTVTEVHDSAIAGANVWYVVQCEPGDPGVALSLNEKQVVEFFERE